MEQEEVQRGLSPEVRTTGDASSSSSLPAGELLRSARDGVSEVRGELQARAHFRKSLSQRRKMRPRWLTVLLAHFVRDASKDSSSECECETIEREKRTL